MLISSALLEVLIPASKILRDKIYSCNAVEAIAFRKGMNASKLSREWGDLVSECVKMEIGECYKDRTCIPLTYMKQKLFPLYMSYDEDEEVDKMFMDMRYDMLHGAYHADVEGLAHVIRYYAKEMRKPFHRSYTRLDINRKIKTLYR